MLQNRAFGCGAAPFYIGSRGKTRLWRTKWAFRSRVAQATTRILCKTWDSGAVGRALGQFSIKIDTFWGRSRVETRSMRPFRPRVEVGSKRTRYGPLGRSGVETTSMRPLGRSGVDASPPWVNVGSKRNRGALTGSMWGRSEVDAAPWVEVGSRRGRCGHPLCRSGVNSKSVPP